MDSETTNVCTTCGLGASGHHQKGVACRYNRMLSLIADENFKATWPSLDINHDSSLSGISDPCVTSEERSFMSAIATYQKTPSTTPPSSTDRHVNALYGDISVPLCEVDGWVNLCHAGKVTLNDVKNTVARKKLGMDETPGKLVDIACGEFGQAHWGMCLSPCKEK